MKKTWTYLACFMVLPTACGPGGSGDGGAGSVGTGTPETSTGAGPGPAPDVGASVPDLPPEPPGCGQMVLVPEGPFWMGCNEALDNRCDPDEYPYHEVYLSAYEIDVCEVTYGEYRECFFAGACPAVGSLGHLDMCPPYSDYLPVSCVTWGAAQAYCRWAGKRLPTEAEWEKAARGTDGRTYPWGEELPDCTRAVVAPDGSKGDCGEYAGLRRGGMFPEGASPYGVLDMVGNAEEWVADAYDPDYYAESPTVDPQGPQDGRPEYRIVRGGPAWPLVEEEVYRRTRTSSRREVPPELITGVRGFRCVRDVE